jgi:type II secretory pathway pseudopilin PulG
MKLFRFHRDSCSARGGFSLVEASFTIGVMSFGLLTLAPLLGLGLKTARHARDDRASAQIARTLIQEAKQGTLGAGTLYLDNQGAACNPLGAAFTAQPTTLAMGVSTSRLTLLVTPIGAPDRARVYAVVLPVPAQN